jgi:phosphomannomutase
MSNTYKNASECWKAIKEDPEAHRELLPIIEEFARTNYNPATISFGTSGWRGEIGTDFTFHNVRIVTRAIIDTLKSDDNDIKDALGVLDFEDVKRRGIVIGHDNRFLGPDFARDSIGMLISEGIKVFYAGETSTPEISASIEMLRAACGLNFTPSHNPSNYAGLKFNPSDGGPAGPEITDMIQEKANKRMTDTSRDITVHPISEDDYESIDTIDLYMQYIKEKKTLDLEKIRRFIQENDCLIVVDHVHGSTRGRPERILDSSVPDVKEKLILLRTEDDYLFGGVAPEPSEANMSGVEDVIKKSDAQFRLGVIIDPDGDRIRFADPNMQIPMNYFGAMALHFLHVHKGIKGIVAKSVGTSNFVNAIAKKHTIPVRETRVGFKNFRPFLSSGATEKAIVSFEESDGISGFNHTLEKDALFGLLLSIEMVATTGKNLSEYLNELLNEYGYYYPDRSGIEVDRSLVGAPLKKKLSVIKEKYTKGGSIQIGPDILRISDVITIDGIKIVLEDGSWLMIRPSGTEPKVRFYIESRSQEGKDYIFDTAERLTKEAISGKW